VHAWFRNILKFHIKYINGYFWTKGDGGATEGAGVGRGFGFEVGFSVGNAVGI
jgi:hypothetical protein